MMRHGKAGLATFMAGYGLGCTLGSTTLAESEPVSIESVTAELG